MNFSLDILGLLLIAYGLIMWWPRRVANNSEELMIKRQELLLLKRYKAYRMNLYISYKE